MLMVEDPVLALSNIQYRVEWRYIVEDQVLVRKFAIVTPC